MEIFCARVLSTVALCLGVVLGFSGTALGQTAPPEHGCAFDRMMLTTRRGVCRPRALSYPSRVHTGVQKAIYDASLTFDVPYPILLKVARCESGLNPKARYRGHFGLYQFLPATFKQGKRLMVRDTGITAHSYWNARDSAYVAGYLFAVGHAPSWTCVHFSAHH